MIVAPIVAALGVSLVANATAETSSANIRVAPAYCGVYSLYGAMRSEGIPCDFKELLTPDVIGSPAGSTVEELVKAGKEHGATVVALSNMTVEDLCEVNCPVLLHVASERNLSVFDHWILFLGVGDGLAKIVDTPHDVELVSFAKLLVRWDSTGLLVSRYSDPAGAITESCG